MSIISDTIHRSLEQGKAELRARVMRPLIVNVAAWTLVALFGAAALIFAYVVADDYLTGRLGDPLEAAAIIAGFNVAVVLILLVARPRGRR